MRAEFTQDKDIIAPVLEALKDVIGDKHSPSVNELNWDFLFSNDLFIAIYDEQTICGIVWFMPEGNDVWGIHMNMLPFHRGKQAIWAWNTGIEMLKLKTNAKKLRGSVPIEYPNTWHFVEKRGCILIKNNGVYKTYELEIV